MKKRIFELLHGTPVKGEKVDFTQKPGFKTIAPEKTLSEKEFWNGIAKMASTRERESRTLVSA